jgi:hypothetical protein
MDPASYSFVSELPPHWLGNLTGHLAAHAVHIEAVRARLLEGGRWEVDVTICAEFCPSERELIAMAQLRYDAHNLDRGPLAQYNLRRQTDTLHLALRAEDRIGFLARLCTDLASHALFPTRVDARTLEGWIEDSFWLVGIGHVAPHAETEAAVRRFLDAWQAGTLSRHPSLRPPSSSG